MLHKSLYVPACVCIKQCYKAWLRELLSTWVIVYQQSPQVAERCACSWRYRIKSAQQIYTWINRAKIIVALVCSSSQLALRIGLYTASLVSLTDVLIGWRASDCDASTHIVTYPNKHREYPPSPTWRASPTWRKQKAFPLRLKKAGNSLPFSEAAGSPMLADMGRETVYSGLHNS